MIEIKKAELSQLDRLMEIEEKTFLPEEQAKREMYQYRMEHQPFWFRSAKVGDQVAGFLCGRPVSVKEGEGVRDEFYQAAEVPEGDTFALLSINVDPDYQRQGIGELMIRTIIFLCREYGMKRIILACKEDRVNYYTKFGFSEIGTSESGLGGSVWYDMELKL